MRHAPTAIGIHVMLLACGLGAGSLSAQTPLITTPSNVPSQSAPTPPVPGSAPAPMGAIDLRPKFRAGQQIRYVFDQVARNSVKSLDATDSTLDQDQRQTQRIGLALKVIEARDEGATIQVVYESIKVTLTTPEGVLEYDSARPVAKPPGAPSAPSTRPPARSPGAPPNPTPVPPSTDPLKELGDLDSGAMLGLIVGPMVGATITVKTDRNGAITSVSGGETLGGSLGGLGGLAGGSMVPSPTAVANWLVSGLGGPGNRGFARVGETWTNNDSLSGTPVGAFAMKTKHTLQSASGGAANLEFSGGIEPTSQGTNPGVSVGQVQSATYSGTYVWDTRSGALADMATNMKVVLDAAAGGIRARTSSDTQIRVRRQ